MQDIYLRTETAKKYYNEIFGVQKYFFYERKIEEITNEQEKKKNIIIENYQKKSNKIKEYFLNQRIKINGFLFDTQELLQSRYV